MTPDGSAVDAARDEGVAERIGVPERADDQRHREGTGARGEPPRPLRVPTSSASPTTTGTDRIPSASIRPTRSGSTPTRRSGRAAATTASTISSVRVVSVTRLADQHRDDPDDHHRTRPAVRDDVERPDEDGQPHQGPYLRERHAEGEAGQQVGAEHDEERRPDLPGVVQEHRAHTGREHHQQRLARPGREPVHHRGPGPVETEGVHAISFR